MLKAKREALQFEWYLQHMACSYHNAMDTKHHLRILIGRVSREVNRCIKTFSEQKGC